MFSISRYLNIRQAYGPTVSSDGSRVAFLTNITGIPQVWAVDYESGSSNLQWPEQLTFAEDRVMTVRYSPAKNDARLIYAHDIGGNENAQLPVCFVAPFSSRFGKGLFSRKPQHQC